MSEENNNQENNKPENNKSKLLEKLKKDKKFRFEFIIGVWSGVIGIVLLVAVVFVAKVYLAGNNTTVDTPDSELVLDNEPVIVSDPAVGAVETQPPYKSALISDNEEDFMDEEDQVDEDLKTAKYAYATTVVNLRREPALTAAVIDKLQPGDMVTIVEYGKEWTKVNYNGTVGYISTIYLNTTKPAAEPESTAQSVRETAKPTEKPTAKPTAKPTKKPKPTAKPTKTQKPEKTDAPPVAVEPEPTKAPDPTKAPEPTRAPEPTKAPDPTKAPEPTKAPDPTKAPEPTAEAIG